MFVHFTTEQDAHAIAASGVLWHDIHHAAFNVKLGLPCTAACRGTCQCADGRVVYAAEVGVCTYVPEVQTLGNAGRVGDGTARTHAVVFEAREPDDRSIFLEEVEWWVPSEGASLPIHDACVVPAAEAITLLTTHAPRTLTDAA